MDASPDFPGDFLQFLKSHTNRQPYEFNDVAWWIADQETLSSRVNIDGVEYRYWNQLTGYASTISEFSGSDVTEDEDGNDYPFARLTAGLAFATGDGDVLYFDTHDDDAVWQFHHDGGDVERLADSFSAWLEYAELDEDY